MGWWVVLQPSGRYARFSDLINDFTEFNLSRAEIMVLCRRELQQNEAEARVAAAETNPMRYRQALDRITTTRGADARFVRQSEIW